MKILVTGARGQVGSELCRPSVQQPGVMEVVGFGSTELDIADLTRVREVVRQQAPDLIINAAAYTAVDKAESDADSACRVNRDGAENLARAADEAGIPIFHISTDYVFDGSSEKPYRESDTVSPLGIYGQSKYQGEQAVAAANPRHIIMRTSWVFGVNGGNFPKTMLRLAGSHPEIRVVDDQRGCPTFARDIADALLVVARKLDLEQTLPWGVYHFSGAEACTWYEFACETLQNAFARGMIPALPGMTPIPTSDYPTPAKRPANSVLDCGKWQSAFP